MNKLTAREKKATVVALQKRKERLFRRLVSFLKTNVELVADARDSNSPWTLYGMVKNFEISERDFVRRFGRKP